MKIHLFILFLITTEVSFAQNKTPEDYGFRHLQTKYRNMPVDILVLSKKGDEHKRKPIFFFVQGSLPTPLIILDKNGKPYRTFVFQPDSLLTQYHLAIVGKPGVPLIARDSDLTNRYEYLDPTTKMIPRVFQDNNYIDYLANRDKRALKFLRKQDFCNEDRIVIAGHSEGGTVAAKLAVISGDVGKLIYASENPFGRILTEMEDARTDDQTGKEADELFKDWQKIVNNKDDISQQKGDTYKGSYQASTPAMDDLLKLKIPVLVTYGTKDHSGKYSDYLHVKTILMHKTNFMFKVYAGLDHNYFGFKPDGLVNYEVFNWDKVVLDWQAWLNGETKLHALQ